VVGIKAVKKITLVVNGRVVSARGSKERRFAFNPVRLGAVGGALKAEAVGDLDFEHLDVRLLNCQVGHFNVQAMEVDTVETLVDSSCQVALAQLVDAFGVMQSAHLVELTEKLVKLSHGSRVLDEGRPEATRQGTVPSLELVDDFVEVPWESQHVSMLLLRELSVDAKSSVFISDVDLALLVLLGDNGCI